MSPRLFRALCNATAPAADHGLHQMPRYRIVAPQEPCAPGVELIVGEDPGRFIVGRDPACDLVLGNASVSRRHCELIVRRGRLWIRDLASKHGSFLGPVPIGLSAVEVPSVGRVRCGLVELHVERLPSTRSRWSSRFAVALVLCLASLAMFRIIIRHPPSGVRHPPSGAAASSLLRGGSGPDAAPADLAVGASATSVSSPQGPSLADVHHRVVPFETLSEVARRYGVSPESIARANALDPDTDDIEELTLLIPSPLRRPLPQQRIVYEVEPGESWSSLAERFGVPVERLRAYNEGIRELAPGTALVVWFDPKPYVRRSSASLPTFRADRRARSVGAPNQGRLDEGIPMPESASYVRRAPYNMWGSAFMVENLQRAIASFRREVDYEGTLVLADMSRRGGGHFPPHKSHQSGRDVDIWLPTFRGIFKPQHLDEERPRKPNPEEVDWYATWALVRALISTGAVQQIFLQWDLQEKVHQAAVEMNATAEELAWIQWPDPKGSSRGILRNSDGHTQHIHVRFRCAPWEPDCVGGPVLDGD